MRCGAPVLPRTINCFVYLPRVSAPLDRKVLRVLGCRVAVVNQARLGQSRKRRSELNRIDRLCVRRDDARLEVGNEYSALLLLSCNA